jgi:hypothetical protein
MRNVVTNIIKTSAVRAFLLACVLLAANSSFALADASALFKQLGGSWRGSGTLTLSDGSRERMSCRGYYVVKSGGSGLSIAILCSSTNYKVELRSSLVESGQGISGSWEERTFHAMGEVSGRASGNRMNLSISGAVTGSISISLGGGGHSVNISTRGTGFTGVSLSLVRG